MQAAERLTVRHLLEGKYVLCKQLLSMAVDANLMKVVAAEIRKNALLLGKSRNANFTRSLLLLIKRRKKSVFE